MNQQFDTNADASTDNAVAPATMPTIDADALPNSNSSSNSSGNDAAIAATIDAGAGVQPLVDRIKSVFDDALAELIVKRDQLYAAAIAPLEQEGNQLSKEYDELEARIRALEAIVPA